MNCSVKLGRSCYSLMNHLLTSERSKWIFVIILVSIGLGIATKNAISYPTECVPSTPVEVSQLIKEIN